MSNISRRTLLAGGAIAAGTALGAALSKAGQRFGLVPPDAGGIYGTGETLAYAAHRVLGRNALAREFPREMISARPFANAVSPHSAAFRRHQAANFATWRLHVHGQVTQPVTLSVAQLRAMPASSQVTEVTCEEGWSYVAEWTGTPLASVLAMAGVRPTSRYIVYYSSDPDWWESIDIDEAMHPQTIVAWGMNGADLPVPFGGPLRLRVPRQLGYKSVKFMNRIVLTDSLDGFGDGSGQSFVNDGYAWYAGI
ncbi:MAG: oxidoreductase, molybdopterin binding protein [Gemmatimonadetes bacterium]|nr:oxidoreductase, molybdopterin binding protein [Gemmatimonadota bacterium]